MQFQGLLSPTPFLCIREVSIEVSLNNGLTFFENNLGITSTICVSNIVGYSLLVLSASGTHRCRDACSNFS
jgi:hypothetical protein